MAGKIEKGYISQILGPADWYGHPTKATVNPASSSGAITAELTIPWFLRGKMGNLQIETCVAYCLFDDATGIILDRLDGEWTGHFDYDTITTGTAVIKKDVTHEANLLTEGNVTTKGNTTITGKATAADLTTGSVGSYNSHVHSCPDGTTSGPR